MAFLRDGYTTGSTATAAAMAAACFLASGKKPAKVDVPLPPFFAKKVSTISVPVEQIGELANGGAFAQCRKDGGDDPDVTSGMILRAEVWPVAEDEILIDGGYGIGRVTLPGLPVAPGQAAINPVPREQIAYGVRRAAGGGWKILLIAPEGESRALATLNQRLGIVGGISILGTQGIVRPFSNAAWLASVRQAIAVARASGIGHLCFSTGRRSLFLMEKSYPQFLPQAFIIAGDFARQTLQAACGFKDLSWGCFFGKLVKLAQGAENTHARESELDLAFLARLTGIPEIAGYATAGAALPLILQECPQCLHELALLAKTNLQDFAGQPVNVHLYQLDGQELIQL